MRLLRSPVVPCTLALVALSACNDIPEGTVVGIEPGDAVTTDDLTAVILTPAVDRHEVNYSYAWSVNGSPSDETGDVVPAALTAKGETWTVVVTPDDGKITGPSAEASVTILNSAPAASVEVAPLAPTTSEDLVATADGSDVDGDTVSFAYAWTRDGASTSWDGSTVPGSATAKGETWEVTVTPNDGEVDGDPVSASVTIVNERPVAESVAVEPLLVFADSTLTAVAAGSDPDGDALTWTYTWYVSGGQVASGSEPTLAGVFAKGDEVLVEAVANDGNSDSNAITSASVTVLNSAPSLEGATIAPAEPRGDSTLTCTAVGAADIDGDPVTTTATWNVDGREVGEHASLDSSSFSKGQQVRCTLTPTDGEDVGAPVTSAAVTIANTPPLLGAISMTPSPARTADTIGVTASGVSDLDGDTVTLAYSWEVGGSVVSTSSTLASSAHSKGDLVEVTVTPNDGDDDGTPLSASLTIANTAPTTPALAIAPASPRPTDDLVCSITTGSVDADGDRIRYTFSWTVDGSSWSGSTSTTTYSGDTIPNSATSDGEVWICSVVADDGTDSSSAGASSVEISSRDGQVRTIAGTWLDVLYEPCGTGTTCTASDARSACSAKGLKVASHASDGTSTVYDLGATASCQWSISYYTNERQMAPSDCLVGVSNLDWSSCCTTTRWHGNSLPFGYTTSSGSPSTVFGYVNSGNSGYVSSYSNTTGSQWGCQGLTAAAPVPSGCTRTYVACVK